MQLRVVTVTSESSLTTYLIGRKGMHETVIEKSALQTPLSPLSKRKHQRKHPGTAVDQAFYSSFSLPPLPLTPTALYLPPGRILSRKVTGDNHMTTSSEPAALTTGRLLLLSNCTSTDIETEEGEDHQALAASLTEENQHLQAELETLRQMMRESVLVPRAHMARVMKSGLADGNNSGSVDTGRFAAEAAAAAASAATAAAAATDAAAAADAIQSLLSNASSMELAGPLAARTSSLCTPVVRDESAFTRSASVDSPKAAMVQKQQHMGQGNGLHAPSGLGREAGWEKGLKQELRTVLASHECSYPASSWDSQAASTIGDHVDQNSNSIRTTLLVSKLGLVSHVSRT